MPRPHGPLPETLRGQPFTTATGRRQLLTPAQLRAGWLPVPHHGVRVEQLLDGAVGRARMLLPVLPPGAAFWGPTAAQLCWLPTPLGWVDDGRVYLAVTPGTTPMRRPGVVCVTRTLRGRRLMCDGDIPVLHPRWQWLEPLPGADLDDHVAVADAVMTGWATPEEMAGALADVHGHRGVMRAEQVLGLARRPVRSTSSGAPRSSSPATTAACTARTRTCGTPRASGTGSSSRTGTSTCSGPAGRSSVPGAGRSPSWSRSCTAAGCPGDPAPAPAAELGAGPSRRVDLSGPG